MNILIVDDEQETLSLLHDILCNEGFHVFACQESIQSLKILDSQKINCVILDLNMPILEGQQILEITKKKHPDIPVIILSAHIKNKEELLDKGAFAVLEKPISQVKLIDSIKEALAAKSNRIMVSIDTLDMRDVKNQVYRQMITLALKKTKGNKVQASKALGISRPCLLRYIKDLNLNS